MFPSSKKQPSTGAASSNDRPMCVQGDSGGLVLTTDPKPRLRWTAELHDRFVDAVAQLGGPDSTYSIEDMMLPFVYFVGNFIGILIALICFLALFSRMCRGNSKDYHEGYGSQGPHPLPSQESPASTCTCLILCKVAR